MWRSRASLLGHRTGSRHQSMPSSFCPESGAVRPRSTLASRSRAVQLFIYHPRIYDTEAVVSPRSMPRTKTVGWGQSDWAATDVRPARTAREAVGGGPARVFLIQSLLMFPLSFRPASSTCSVSACSAILAFLHLSVSALLCVDAKTEWPCNL